jgi:hypothetical protein
MGEEIKDGQTEMRAIVDAWLTDIKDTQKKTTRLPRSDGGQSRENGTKSRRKGGRSQAVGDS